ncbi:MAG: hypothetical protein MK235_01560 [Candidatus Poseidoniales archaeon]|nr:hypothetical protein [Candidatus Poseidoniales archaeon]
MTAQSPAHRLLPLLLALLLSTSALAGCLHGDDEAKPGPVKLVWTLDATNGTVHHMMVPNSNNQTQDIMQATFEFDFNETYSEGGDVTEFFVIPGDGSPTVVVDASSQSIVSVDYDSHGIFRATVGANDSEGNSATGEVLLRVEYMVHYNNTQATGDPNPVWFELTGGSEEASPARVDVSSHVVNPDSIIPFSGGSATVTWTVHDGEDAEIDSQTAEVADGAEADYAFFRASPEPGGWRLEIGVDGDDIETYSDVHIIYDHLETPAEDVASG